MFRGYSAERRDRAPLIETEDFREEGARRFWDDYSPPYFGFKKGPNDTWQYNSESFALAGVKRYWAYWRTAFPTPTRRTPSGRAMRPSTSPIPTPTAARIPARSAASAARWTPCACPRRFISPPRDAERTARHPHPGPLDLPGRNDVKTVYVIANTSSRWSLFVNGKSLGVNPTGQRLCLCFPKSSLRPAV
jgi:beta-galactosidase